MKKSVTQRFTLIELIVVIVIISILAAIVIPNIGDQKKSAIISTLNGNVRNIQTAVDMYSLRNNGELPTSIQPTLENPQINKIDELYPEYLKSKPDKKIPEQYYWVDAFGKVWGSTVQSPSGIFKSSSYLEWNHDKQSKGYQLYLVKEDEQTGKLSKKTYSIMKEIPIQEQVERIRVEQMEGELLVSSLDEYGMETAPRGLEMSQNNDWFTPIVNKEGKMEYKLESDELMYWVKYRAEEHKPEGTSVEYLFSYLMENGEYSEFTSDFSKLNPSKSLKIKVVTKGYNGLYPSVMNLQVYYHYAIEEVIPASTVYRENVDEKNIVINPMLPVKIVNQFVLTEKLKDIVITDYYREEQLKNIQYTYKAPNQTSFSQIISFEDVPQGSLIQIEKEFIDGRGLIINQPIVKQKEQVEFYQPSVTVPKADGWETIQTLSVIGTTGDGQIAKWTNSVIDDVKPDNTRIVYTYSYSSSDGSFAGSFNDITEVPVARSVRVTAKLQVNPTAKANGMVPELKSITLYNERGYTNLSLVNPSVAIIPSKSNNKNSDAISETTTITWNYEASDPRNKKITDVEWSGDKRNQYPIGTYTVQARVKNESGYWSNWTSYTFKVVSEKPIAKISMSPETGITTKTVINWGYAGSTDPDGDGIQKAEWIGQQNNYSLGGNYTVKLRVQDNEDNWSDWVEKTFMVEFVPTFKSMELANGYGLGLTEDDRVMSWGSNNQGQMAIGTTDSNFHSPAFVPNLPAVQKITTYGYNTFVLTKDGDVYTWGSTNNGMSGLGVDSQTFLTPTKITNLPKVKDLFVVRSRVFALTESGEIYGWGSNSGRTLVDVAIANILTPTKITSLTPYTGQIKKIEGGASHVIALLSDGRVLVWGSGAAMGLGSTTSTPTPTVLTSLSGVKDIVASNQSSLAVLQNGDTYMWGSNSDNWMAMTSPLTITTPMKHPTLIGVKEIKLGTYSGYAVFQDGRGAAFGSNDTGTDPVSTGKLNFLPELNGVIKVDSNSSARNVAFYKSDGTMIGFGMFKNVLTLKYDTNSAKIPIVMPTLHPYK